MAKDSGTQSSGPSKYAIVDLDALEAARVGEVEARSRGEAVRVFAEANPEALSGKTITSLPERQMTLAREAAVSVTVENKPVVSIVKTLTAEPPSPGSATEAEAPAAA